MTQYSQEIYQAQKKVYEDIVRYIELVRRCQTPEDYYSVQQELETKIDYVDEAAENAIQHGQDLGRDFYYRLGHQYRTVGDAIAWQVYAFQALPIFSLSRNQFPGYRTRNKRKGLDEEKARIKTLWETYGAFALHHDCTNCLRIGDLSVFYPDRLTLPEIEEVKFGGRKVSSHQKRRMRIASDLATNHYSTQDDVYDLIHRTHTSSTVEEIEQTNLGLLWQALLKAREGGLGFAANSYIAIDVIDLHRLNSKDFEQTRHMWNSTTNKMLFPDVWPIYCTDILSSNSWERMSRANLGVPYTVYPLPSDYVAAIVTGAIVVHYRLNTNAIKQALCDAGFEVECLLGEWRSLGQQPPRKARPPYFRIRRQDISITIGSLPIHQIWFEGVKLEDFISSLVSWFEEEILSKISTSGDVPFQRPLQMFATYTNTERVWASSRNFLMPIHFKTEEAEENTTAM